jgi:hypothetical protein
MSETDVTLAWILLEKGLHKGFHDAELPCGEMEENDILG